MIYIQRCNDCRRLIGILEIEPYELWLVEEEEKNWRKICWVCNCKKDKQSHIDRITDMMDCGCGG